MSLPGQFCGPRLKIERAKQHIADLHSSICAFATTDFCSLDVNQEVETGKYCLKVAVKEPLPHEFALIIGDAVHNLKSALDITVNEVVFRRLNRYDKHTDFRLEIHATILRTP